MYGQETKDVSPRDKVSACQQHPGAPQCKVGATIMSAMKPENVLAPRPIGRNGTIPSLTRTDHGLMDWSTRALQGEMLDPPSSGSAPARPLAETNHAALMLLNAGIVPLLPMRCRYRLWGCRFRGTVPIGTRQCIDVPTREVDVIPGARSMCISDALAGHRLIPPT